MEDFMGAYGSGSSDSKHTPPKIGEILVQKGLITEDQLREALKFQEQRGGRLGWVVLSQGWVNRLDFFRALAEHFRLPFWDFDYEKLDKTLDRELIKKVEVEDVIRYHGIPLKKEENILVVLTDYPIKHDSIEFFKELFKVDEIRLWVITDLDFMHIVQQLYGKVLIDRSVHGLFYRYPGESAYPVLTKTQVAILGLVLYSTLIWVYLDVVSFLVFCLGLCQVIFAVSVSYKVVLSFTGASYEVSEPIRKEEVETLRDHGLPVYSVLVPVYREPETIHILIESLKKLDYPQEKLDVLLLLEEDDRDTLEAAKAAKPPGNWRFIIIPDALPKTKPKACNYGVFFCRGEYLTIYDAEDIPEPDQLKKAIIAFEKYDKSYICFQAALNYFNANENLISRLFTLEYSYWFDYLLPGLDRLKLPIPLGGTSNHFRVEYLKELGAWDPFNVTEDADLGIRACAKGMKVGIINSTTYEEANTRYGNWIRQRSRWIKGYMQTTLVYNRHPLRMLKKIGLKNWLSFQLFIGGTPLLFLVNPIVWSIFIYWLATQTKALDPLFPPVVVYLGLYNLLIGNFLGIYLNMIAVFRRKLFGLLAYALLNPFYWLCFHSVAAYKALWQLFSKPFYWEKTTHGITRIRI